MRQAGEQRFKYSTEDKVIDTGKRKWALKDVPPHVIYEWIREDRIFKGVLVDWLSQKVFWKRAD